MIRSGDIRDKSLKLSKIAPNFARFKPQFSLGRPPEFFHVDYKTGHNSDYVAKFQGDRPRKLGDLALENRKIKETAVKN